MISKGPTVYETSYDLLRETLRGVLWVAVESGPDTGVGMGSVPWRAGAALYSLVEGHPVDRRGRCRSCRRPGAVLGRARRRCQVRIAACYRLQQPDETLLLGLLVRELDQDDLRTPTQQSPAVPRPPLPGGDSPRAGRSDPDHGGVGGDPRPRRDPPDDPRSEPVRCAC